MMKENLPLDAQYESLRFTKRSMIIAAIVLGLFLCLFARLIYLQLVQNHFYTTLSKKNIINIIPVKPDRGLIYDRNGVLVARNVPVYSLMIVPGRVSELQKTISALTPIVNLTPNEIDRFYKNLKNYRRFQEVPLKDELSESELDQFYVDQYRFPGAIIKVNSIRQYPLGEIMGDVIGYVGRINPRELSQLPSDNYMPSDEIGKLGIEAADEALLHGTMGAQEVEINARGKIVRVLKETPAIPGKSIYLTIDSKLQAYAEKVMIGKSGAIVALQPDTGEVLALVTNPTYDPNPFVEGISHKEYAALLNAPGHPLFNRAIRGLYPPGSTVKPFISSYALEQGVIDPKTEIHDPGFYSVPNTEHIFHDWKREGHGWVNDYKAIIVSCDSFFYGLADKLGVKRLNEALADFGFGQKTNIDIPDERAGILPTPEWKRAYHGQAWYTGDTIQTGIGQGYFVATPLQLVFATAIMAEHGKKMTPHLLLKVDNLNGDVHTIMPTTETPLNYKNEDAWGIPIEGMRGVIMDPQGTAWIFGKNAPYTAAAKTGTAQVYGHSRDEESSEKNIPEKLRNNHLFIVFAPIDHPQIALAVIIEHNPLADLTARKILDFYFQEQQQQAQQQAQQLPQPQQQAQQQSPQQQPVQLPQPQQPQAQQPQLQQPQAQEPQHADSGHQ